MTRLTARQQEVLRLLRSGQATSYRAIGKQMGIKSVRGVENHIIALERKGYVLRSGCYGRASEPAQVLMDEKGRDLRQSPIASRQSRSPEVF